MNWMDHETYLMTHEMLLFGDKNFHAHLKLKCNVTKENL